MPTQAWRVEISGSQLIWTPNREAEISADKVEISARDRQNSWPPKPGTHADAEGTEWLADLQVGGSHAASTHSGCGVAPARLALQSGSRRRVQARSAPSGVWWSGSAGAQQGTWRACQQTPGVAAPPLRPRRHRAGVELSRRGGPNGM